jgi:transcriptional regulator with XRE-family HTH domain
VSIGERIKKLRKHLDLTQQKFGERLGIKGNTVAQYELGRNEPIDAVLSLLCKEFNVNENWLRTGEGEMFEQLTEQQKLMKYTALLLKNKDSAIATAIQTLIVTYEQLDDTSKATLEKIALQYIDNLKKSQ